MPDAPTHARPTSKRGLRAAAASVLAAVLAAPLAGTAAATSTRAASPELPLFSLGFGPRTWFSPDGDEMTDKAMVWFTLTKKARVTVKVRRANKARTLVHKEDLGKLRARTQVWKWNGKDLERRVVGDGKYYVTFVGDPVGSGKEEKFKHVLWADTRFTKVTSTLSLDTVYPQTTLIHDAVEVRVSGRTHLNTVKRIDWSLVNPHGDVVRTGHRVGGPAVAFPFDGRDVAGAPLPGGTYTLRLRVKDLAGNRGKAAPLTVRIDDKPLVEKVETLVVRPTGTQTASGTAGGTNTPADPSTDPRIQPCGEVVPSTTYGNPGAQSYRSADWCTYRTLPHMAWAEGRVDLDTITFAEAPRGLYSWQASMRGRPTVAGETDTAELHLERMEVGVYSPHPHTHGSVSPATTEETVTSTPVATATQQPTYSRWTKTPYVRWVIATHGTDSYDVADVTVRYSYLTPQP